MNLKKAALAIFLSVAVFPVIASAKAHPEHMTAPISARAKSPVARFFGHFPGHKKH